MANTEKNGYVIAKVSKKFLEEIEKVSRERIINGKSKKAVGVKKITHMICLHKLWAKISEDISNVDEKEINKFFSKG